MDEVGSHVLDKHKSFAMKHINYEASMVSTGIVGICDVDKKMDIMSVTDPDQKRGEMNLRAVLYNLKLQDEHSLVGEVHQAGPMSPVDVVVGNTEEASKMIEMMNKNVAAYLYHMMLSWKMEKVL